MGRLRITAAAALVLGLSGCAGYKTTVYGGSGKQYMAPDLCGAIVACRQANETECLYTANTVTTVDGRSTETISCKAAK